MAQEDGDVLGRVQYHGGSYEWDSNVSSALCWRIPYDDYGAYTDVIYPMMTLENQCDRFPHESILLPDVEWEGAGALKGRLKYLLVAEFICQLSDDADWEASTRFVDAIMQENMGKLYEVIRRIDDAAEAEYGGSKMVKYSNGRLISDLVLYGGYFEQIANAISLIDYTEAGSSRVLERYNACMKAAKETGDS